MKNLWIRAEFFLLATCSAGLCFHVQYTKDLLIPCFYFDNLIYQECGIVKNAPVSMEFSLKLMAELGG